MLLLNKSKRVIAGIGPLKTKDVEVEKAKNLLSMYRNELVKVGDDSKAKSENSVYKIENEKLKNQLIDLKNSFKQKDSDLSLKNSLLEESEKSLKVEKENNDMMSERSKVAHIKLINDNKALSEEIVKLKEMPDSSEDEAKNVKSNKGLFSRVLNPGEKVNK